MFRTAFATLALVLALSPAGHAQMRGGIGQGGFGHGMNQGGGRVNGLGAVGGVGFGYGGFAYPGFGGFSYPAYGYAPSYYGYYPGPARTFITIW